MKLRIFGGHDSNVEQTKLQFQARRRDHQQTLEQGLAYSVSGGFNTSAFDHKGLFLAGGETAAVGDFISALERVLQVGLMVMHSTLHRQISQPSLSSGYALLISSNPPTHRYHATLLTISLWSSCIVQSLDCTLLPLSIRNPIILLSMIMCQALTSTQSFQQRAVCSDVKRGELCRRQQSFLPVKRFWKQPRPRPSTASSSISPLLKPSCSESSPSLLLVFLR